MPEVDAAAFLDSNIVLYALGDESEKRSGSRSSTPSWPVFPPERRQGGIRIPTNGLAVQGQRKGLPWPFRKEQGSRSSMTPKWCKLWRLRTAWP